VDYNSVTTELNLTFIRKKKNEYLAMTKFRVKKRTIKLPLASAASEWPQNLLMSAFSHKVIPHLEGHIIPLFIRVGSDRTKGNGFKLEKGRSGLNIRKKFFTMRRQPETGCPLRF